MAKKEYVVFTLEADSHGHSIGHGRWKEWGAGETEIQNRSELVKSVQKSAKKSNGCVKVRKRYS